MPESPVRAVRSVGRRAVLAELDRLADVVALAGHLTARPVPGQVEVVAAARTVLVSTVSEDAARAAADVLRRLVPLPPAETTGEEVHLEVVYDGADLDAVAARCGLSVEGFVTAHTGQTWTAAFCGFSPGLAYLAGDGPALDVPRRDSPRTSVPAGSVALAGGYSTVYPSASPGGWQLVGRTGARMWDVERADPALLSPGGRVRFSAVRAVVTAGPAPAPPVPREQRGPGGGLRVVRALPQVLVQDLGRPGLAALGVAASGAADRDALRRGARLVGNPADAAGLEVLDGGFGVRADGDQVLALTGAPAPATVTGTDGRSRRPGADRPFALLDGELLELARPPRGLRSYLAVRGGLDVPAVLGSRSRDVLSGLGPAPLRAGELLPVGAPRGAVGVPETGPPDPDPGPLVVLDVVLGPREDWISPRSLADLPGTTWTVTPDLDRVGVRLAGPALQRARSGELQSEATVPGAVQVPPDGQPVVFGPDHPTTGGYPVLGVVVPAHLGRLAQVRPGDRVRLHPVPARPADRPSR